MKKVIYIIYAIVILFFVCSCEKDSNLQSKIVGEWHCTMTDGGQTLDVYLSFAPDGNFEMYQMTGEGPYWYSSGKYYLDYDSKILSGKYSDGYLWKYKYEVSASAETLIMKALGLEDYSVSYKRVSIPDEVKAKSLPLTKSEDVEFFL